jgi:sulfoxide reductase catalytic subunit YedY
MNCQRCLLKGQRRKKTAFGVIVDPAGSHQHRARTAEREVEGDERVPTQIFNGYEQQVAALYADHASEELFM